MAQIPSNISKRRLRTSASPYKRRGSWHAIHPVIAPTSRPSRSSVLRAIRSGIRPELPRRPSTSRIPTVACRVTRNKGPSGTRSTKPRPLAGPALRRTAWTVTNSPRVQPLWRKWRRRRRCMPSASHWRHLTRGRGPVPKLGNTARAVTGSMLTIPPPSRPIALRIVANATHRTENRWRGRQRAKPATLVSNATMVTRRWPSVSARPATRKCMRPRRLPPSNAPNVMGERSRRSPLRLSSNRDTTLARRAIRLTASTGKARWRALRAINRFIPSVRRKVRPMPHAATATRPTLSVVPARRVPTVIATWATITHPHLEPPSAALAIAFTQRARRSAPHTEPMHTVTLPCRAAIATSSPSTTA